jgi:hypothetical protein
LSPVNRQAGYFGSIGDGTIRPEPNLIAGGTPYQLRPRLNFDVGGYIENSK